MLAFVRCCGCVDCGDGFFQTSLDLDVGWNYLDCI